MAPTTTTHRPDLEPERPDKELTMTTTKGKFTRIAIAAGMTGAMALTATGASAATSKTERAVLGALLGAAAGGAVSHGDGSGIAIGAVAGAALGAATAKDKHYSSRYRDSRAYYGDARYSRGARDYYGRRYDTRYDSRYDNRYDHGYRR
jgi:hypothetical protein